MKPLLVAIGFLFIKQVAGQDSIRVVRQYENDKPITAVDSAYHMVRNVIFISLDEGFEDSVLVTVNDTVILNEYLKTNESIGLAGSFGIHFTDSCEIKDLKIRFIKANRYIQERVNLNYKSLQIRGLNPWHLIYTNRFPMRM